MTRPRLLDVLPDYVAALSHRLHEAAWGHLADSMSDVRIYGVSVADEMCGLQTASSAAERIGALPVSLAEEIVHIKYDRIVHIEVTGPGAAREMVRGLTSIAAAG